MPRQATRHKINKYKYNPPPRPLPIKTMIRTEQTNATNSAKDKTNDDATQ